MFTNYLRVAARNLARQKTYAIINILGLGIGMASCILIFAYIQDDLAYDRFHEDYDRIYRVQWEAKYGDNAWRLAWGPTPLAGVIAAYPEVEQTARIRRESRTFKLGGEGVSERNVYFVDHSFFDLFTIEFLEGSSGTAFSSPEAIVLTEEAALRYAPGRNRIGKTIELSDGSQRLVTGVVKGFPNQSHLQFDFLRPISGSTRVERQKGWGSGVVHTYAKLTPGAKADTLERKVGAFVRENGYDKTYIEHGGYSRFPFQALTDIHLTPARRQQIAIYALIAAFVIALAGINYVNLTTATSTKRAMEVAVRKVMGSHRAQLIRLFLVESFIYVSMALLLALAITDLGMPYLGELTGKPLASTSLLSLPSLIGIGSIWIVVALVAGVYPAFFLASHSPARVIGSGRPSSPKSACLRNGLVIAQFTISIALIVGAATVQDQLAFVRSKHLGFDREHVLVIEGAGALRGSLNTFLESLKGHAQVSVASAAQFLPGRDRFDSTLFKIEQPANYEESSLPYTMVDEHFVDALGLDLIEGRNFDLAAFPTDSTAFLMNQVAAAALGWDHPVGRWLTNAGREGVVIGLIRDFHYGSLKHEIAPLVLPFLRWRAVRIAVRLNKGPLEKTIASIRGTWKQFVPDQPFVYSFLDEDYDRLYRSEQSFARVVEWFSGLTIFIAAMGLFGLSAFSIEQRTKEVGIRKTLGATGMGILLLLTRDFAKPVVIANLLAWPIAYWAMTHWLDDFAYRIDIGLGTFLVSGAFTFGIALLTISIKAIKGANAAPVDALRYE